MSKLAKTRYTSTDPAAVELGWQLKRINETHEMRLRKLMEEFKTKSHELTEASQAEQTSVFEAIARKVGLEASVYGNGCDWALSIANIAEGEISMVHSSDADRASDDCECPVCQIRRSLGIALKGDDDEQSHSVH
jgi:hypothetical protein